jgi:CheY-like chemotaxis protein
MRSEARGVNVDQEARPVAAPQRSPNGRSAARATAHPLAVTARALRALAVVRAAQHARPTQALGFVGAPGEPVGFVLDEPGTGDQIFALGDGPILFVGAELGRRCAGRVLDHAGAPGQERFVLGPARQRILATEDDPGVRALLTDVLEDAGYLVTFCADQAVGQVAAIAPDLLLLDGRGRGADSGWAFLERLKADPTTAAIPTLVLTGLGRAADEHDRHLAELDTALMHKPVDLDDLLVQVRDRLAGRSSRESPRHRPQAQRDPAGSPSIAGTTGPPTGRGQPDAAMPVTRGAVER